MLPPGRKFNIYHQLLYFYSNHTDVHLPISVATELLPPTRPTISKNPNYSKYKIEFSKARTRSASYPTASDSAKPSDHPSCCSIVAQLDDLLLWACGPDQKTLGVCVCVCVRVCVREVCLFIVILFCRCGSSFICVYNLPRVRLILKLVAMPLPTPLHPTASPEHACTNTSYTDG